MEPKYLSEEFGLFRPSIDYSVAGILPTIIDHWSTDILIDPSLDRNPTVARLIAEEHPNGYDHVILVLADGLGARRLEELGGPLFEQMQQHGCITSSVFPTMTSTVMTSLLYGCQPVQHGVIGYNIRNYSLDVVWNALRMRYRDGFTEVTLEQQLDKLVTGRPLTSLIAMHAPTAFLTPHYLKPPGLGNLLNPDLPRQPYAKPDEAISTIHHSLKQLKSFNALYLLEIDSAGHEYGPNSEAYREAVTTTTMAINQLIEHPKVKDGSTLVLLTSDHGQTHTTDAQWMNAQHWDKLVAEGVMLSSSGRVIHGYDITGSDDHGHVKEVLEELAAGKGLVINRQQAMQLAGGPGQPKNDIGDYLLLFGPDYLYGVPSSLGGDATPVMGQHGSLTAAELYVPTIIFSGG